MILIYNFFVKKYFLFKWISGKFNYEQMSIDLGFDKSNKTKFTA